MIRRFVFTERLEFDDTPIFASASSGTYRALADTDTISTWREAIAREGGKGHRSRRSARSPRALLRG